MTAAPIPLVFWCVAKGIGARPSRASTMFFCAAWRVRVFDFAIFSSIDVMFPTSNLGKKHHIHPFLHRWRKSIKKHQKMIFRCLWWFLVFVVFSGFHTPFFLWPHIITLKTPKTPQNTIKYWTQRKHRKHLKIQLKHRKHRKTQLFSGHHDHQHRLQLLFYVNIEQMKPTDTSTKTIIDMGLRLSVDGADD